MIKKYLNIWKKDDYETVLLKDTFNNVVDAYDKARPTYPKELLEDILNFANLEIFESGLEVGAGRVS